MNRLTCWLFGGHSWSKRYERMYGGMFPGPCMHCGKEDPNGNRQDHPHPGSVPGTIPLGPPGERSRGAITAQGSRASTRLTPEPVAQEILAWRGWRLDRLEGQWVLKSLAHEVQWLGPTLSADQVPSEETAHGIYALKNADGVLSSYMAMTDYKVSSHLWGQVALSGIVLEGVTGYRAERATVRSIEFSGAKAAVWNMNGWNNGNQCIYQILEDLSERYQCPVMYTPGSTLPAEYVAV